MLQRICSIVLSMSVLMTSAASVQTRPRESRQLPLVDQSEVEDHLLSLRELAIMQERAERRRPRQVVERQFTKPLVHRVPTLSKSEIAIRYALGQVGKPYVWAADGPRSYDCSGLVLASFARIGIKLPHFTGTMIGYGKRVSRADMRRGDIVFPESGHVGIYLGNDQLVHASSSKGRVVVGKLYTFYAARRLIG